jgi:hypothetical protein
VKAALIPAVAVLLAALPGCRPATATAERFEAWEEGMTMIFENPTLPDASPASQRFHERYQKQVVRSVEAGGERRVGTQFTTFQGQQVVSLVLRDGGVQFQDAQGRAAMILPQGFPERTSSWTSGDYRMKVLGRARWDRDKPVFPAIRPPEGVWVEGEPLGAGTRTRVFYLPDFGEVEKREWRGGSWVTTNLMVGFSFQEVPRPKERG